MHCDEYASFVVSIYVNAQCLRCTACQRQTTLILHAGNRGVPLQLEPLQGLMLVERFMESLNHLKPAGETVGQADLLR